MEKQNLYFIYHEKFESNEKIQKKQKLREDYIINKFKEKFKYLGLFDKKKENGFHSYNSFGRSYDGFGDLMYYRYNRKGVYLIFQNNLFFISELQLKKYTNSKDKEKNTHFTLYCKDFLSNEEKITIKKLDSEIEFLIYIETISKKKILTEEEIKKLKKNCFKDEFWSLDMFLITKKRNIFKFPFYFCDVKSTNSNNRPHITRAQSKFINAIKDDIGVLIIYIKFLSDEISINYYSNNNIWR